MIRFPEDSKNTWRSTWREGRSGGMRVPSTVSCEAVAAWTVVMRPCLMPNFSLTTLTRGARPLVVHDAHETTCIDFES